MKIEVLPDQEIRIKEKSYGIRIIEICNKCSKKLKDLNPGEKFKIADWTFIVLDHDECGTLVISDDLLLKGEQFGESRNYKESYIKDKIENKILPIVENFVGSENVIEHCTSLESVDLQNEYGEVRCKMRPISFEEARKYNNLLVNKDLDDWYWTLTPWSTAERGWGYLVAVVSPSGIFNYGRYSSVDGVRPVCILNSDIFVSAED